MAMHEFAASAETGKDIRLLSRIGNCGNTSGRAPGYLQANIIVLPSRFAADFRLLCSRNPVPCPLIAESAKGQYSQLKSHLPPDGGQLAGDLDLRYDAPRYNVYSDGRLTKANCVDISEEWTEDHIAFLIGCSFSFETALSNANLEPPHTKQGRNVPMYRTAIPLCASGVFTSSTFIVSLRYYPISDVDRVRNITRPYVSTHGEPLDWGWDSLKHLGIADIDKPDWGDAPMVEDSGDWAPLGESQGSSKVVPIFWGCGVTPQEAVMRAKLPGLVMAHAPGHMIVLDAKYEDVVGTLL